MEINCIVYANEIVENQSKRKLLITDLETLINLNEYVFSNFASLV